MYLHRVPAWLRKRMPKGKWKMSPGLQMSVFLTFDDGPHPEITPFVLKKLAEYSAKATFFCVGNNVVKYPDLYQQIIDEGHRVGSHTYQHLDGWKVGKEKYIKDIERAGRVIHSDLFRPPYGRLKAGQAKALEKMGKKLIYWSYLTGDFDEELSPQKCYDKIQTHIEPGDIIVFHDSEKARERLEYAFPRTLALGAKNGWQFKTL